MEAVFYYLLKVNLAMAILVLVFYIFFRRRKFLQLNRVILLMTGVLSFALPFLPEITYEVAGKAADMDWQHMLPVTEDFAPSPSVRPSVVKSYAVIEWGIMAYVLLSAVFFSRLFLHIIRTLRIIRSAHRTKLDGLIFCSFTGQGPFSFFNYIVIPENANRATDQEVILHERAHAKQWHSADALFSEMIAAVLWINPAVYLYKKLVRANLEFLADDNVLKSGADRKAYQLSLLRHVMGSGPAIAVNAFNLSGIKTRIGMMNTEVPPARKAIRYIFITPFICLVYISVNPPKAVAGIQLPDMFTMNAAKTLPNSKQEAELLQALTPVENKRVDTTDPLQKEDRRVAAVNLLNEINYRVNIDAKTDTVRISLVPAEEIHGKKFDGIYIIGNNEYSDNEIRELAANGTYEILLPARPALIYYQPGHQQAIQQWGAKAANGVILIQPPSSITP